MNGDRNATAGLRELLLLWHLILPDIILLNASHGEEPGYAHCVLLVCFQVLADALLNDSVSPTVFGLSLLRRSYASRSLVWFAGSLFNHC